MGPPTFFSTELLVPEILEEGGMVCILVDSGKGVVNVLTDSGRMQSVSLAAYPLLS